MKTNNTIVSSIMRYICAILLVIGTSISAWATTITLKVWDHSAGAYITYGTIDNTESLPKYDPQLYDSYYDAYYNPVAWAPGEQTDFVWPGTAGSNYYSQGYGWPNGVYSGSATTLYAVYYTQADDAGDYDYYYTTKPSYPIAEACSTSPTVTAGSNSSVASTSATVSCSSGISALGDCGITSYGFVYGTSSNPTTSNSIAQVGTSYTSTGTSFSKGLTGLSANTTYYVRPYATNGGGTGYGAQTSFTTKPQYTISYNNNGGSGSISSQTKDYDVSLTLNGGGSFSKTGYSLSKWHTNADGTSGTDYALGGSYTANAGATMYAIWTPEEYTITLNNQSATSAGSTSITVTYGESTNLTGTPAITVPTKTGYTFGGYYTETGGNGGQVIAANGNVIAEANDGVSEYFTDEDKKWIYANDLTLYAKWTADQYTITLNDNDATTSGTASVKATYNSSTLSASITNPEKTDKEFAGWYSGEGGTGSMVITTSGQLKASVDGYTGTGGIWTKTSGTTLYAKWVTSVYTVTYNMHGVGVAPEDEEVESSSKATKPDDPVAEDYHFKGWYEDDGGNIGDDVFDFANTSITGNTTIHAKWEAVTYSETLKAWCDPDIEITGDIHLTSTNGIPVYSTSTTSNLLGINSDDLSGVTKLEIKYLDADNGDAEVANASSLFRLCNDGTSNYNTADGSQIDVSASNTCDLSYSIRYTPSAHNVINHYKLQITMKRGTRAVKTVTKDLYGRSLPEEFVIASKFVGEWYALPNTLEALEKDAKAVTGVKITVDNTGTPTEATYAPDIAVYQAEGRNAANTHRYAVRLTDGTNHLQVSTTGSNNNMWLSATGSENCQDWWLSSSNFGAYEVTIPSVGTKKIGIYGGNIGYYASPTSPSGQIYFLPIVNKLENKDATITEWGRKSVIVEVDAQSASSAQARLGTGEAEKVVAFGQTRTSVASSASKYNYTLRFSTLDFSEHKGELLYIDWLDEGDNVQSTSAITIPWIIASSGKMSSIDGTKGHWANEEVHVLPGVALEADAGEFESKNVAIKTLEVYQGATVNITKGTKADGTLNVTNLIMRNGWTRAGSKEYDVARVYINSDNASLAASNVYADWYIDFDQYYPIAVPWNVTTTGITYLNTSNAARDGVKMRYYDGEGRANGTNGSAADGANWLEYSRVVEGKTYNYPETLNPGKGYAMTARRPTGKAFSIVRLPLTLPNGTWGEGSWTTNGEAGTIGAAPSDVHKDTVYVHAWGVDDESKPRYAVGWNFIANPYMSIYQGPITHSEGSSYNVEFVTIPDTEFKEYDQYPVGVEAGKGEKLLPASGFFIQTAKDGTLTFGTGNRQAAAPSFRNEVQNLTNKQKAYIVLNDEENEDMMGLLVSDLYTADYDINGDLEKLMGEANSLKTYMRYNEMNMAYVAINEELAREWIPITVRIPENGEYTYSLHEASIVDELEGVYLIDYQNGNVITNLLDNSYTFYSPSGIISGRFAINAIVGMHDTPTDVDIINAGGDIKSNQPFKFIYNDKVFILHNGIIYDSTGKKVREIKK